jgi:hypothetical protein
MKDIPEMGNSHVLDRILCSKNAILVEGEMLITNKDQLQAAYKLPTLSD